MLFWAALNFLCPNLLADNHGTLWGQVLDSSQTPLMGVQINISKADSSFEKILLSNENGIFQILGLSPGRYSLHVEEEEYLPHHHGDIFIEPSQTLYLKVTLYQTHEQKPSFSQLQRLEYTHAAHQTILGENQIFGLPSANDIWSLVENQDLSATTNRIDVGGLWGGIPALFSARGGTSWTQNVYLLNGFDVSDPYWTGKPLFHPDFYSLLFTRMIDAGHPPQALTPGGQFHIITREGTDQFHGGFSAIHTQQSLQSSNITADLQNEGLFESHTFDYLWNGNVHMSGPIISNKLNFYSSVTAFDLSRNIAENPDMDRSSLISGLMNLKYVLPAGNLRFFWTGQILSHPAYGADRYVPFSTTSDRKETYNIIQAIWNSVFRNNHLVKAGISCSWGNIRSQFQGNSQDNHAIEIFSQIPSGIAPMASQDNRRTLTFLLQGESLFAGFLNARHKLQYGFQGQHAYSSSYKEIHNNLHQHFYNGDPLEVVLYNSPLTHKEAAWHMNFYAQDTLTMSSFFSFYLGFNLAYSQGNPLSDAAGGHSPAESQFTDNNKISWLNLSPRAGVIIPLNKSKTSALKISLARYYYTLPLNYMTQGNPDALGGLVYTWNDQSGDKIFQTEELGYLLRREGPFYAAISPEIKRPFTNEFAISYTTVFGSSWEFYLGGFYRVAKNLIRSLNSGVTFNDYEPLYYTDAGDDREPFNYDDLLFTIYNQNRDTQGQDFFLLTNIEQDTRNTSYFGFDLNLIKKFGSKFTFFLSLTATQAEGSTNPGNTEWENDDGVLGTLFYSPNTLINAEGRVRFDRAYTGRLGFTYFAPWGIKLGCLIKYYDGQPFTRKIIIEGLNQGPIYIQAHSRGVARYEYNRTIDIRLEKTVNIGKSQLRIILDGFNITNRGLATEENEWTGPEFPLRYATEIQSPRIFRIGLAYDF